MKRFLIISFMLMISQSSCASFTFDSTISDGGGYQKRTFIFRELEIVVTPVVENNSMHFIFTDETTNPILTLITDQRDTLATWSWIEDELGNIMEEALLGKLNTNSWLTNSGKVFTVIQLLQYYLDNYPEITSNALSFLYVAYLNSDFCRHKEVVTSYARHMLNHMMHNEHPIRHPNQGSLHSVTVVLNALEKHKNPSTEGLSLSALLGIQDNSLIKYLILGGSSSKNDEYFLSVVQYFPQAIILEVPKHITRALIESADQDQVKLFVNVTAGIASENKAIESIIFSYFDKKVTEIHQKEIRKAVTEKCKQVLPNIQVAIGEIDIKITK